MEKNFKTGAILTIVTGGLGILAGIVLLAILQYAYLWGIVLAGALFELVLGLFTAVAGVFALRGKAWSLALAAAVIGILVFFPTALLAILFLALGRKGLRAVNVAA
ncbi:MAG: hypothetical protein GYA17_15580 [Chloroflexi bacterium]|nr:hypothetical protein [Anaerolineaceae bacterium]NMB89780.1 hypothetical protein [Chloroflexota bacterium]